MTRAIHRAAPADVATVGQVAQPQDPAPAAADLQQVRNALGDVAAAAEEGLNEIESIAALALLALENPGAYRSPELLAGAFRSILGRVQMLADVINSDAERVGCHHVNLREMRRREAHRASGVRS